MGTATRSSTRIEIVLARLVMVVMAAGMVYVGATLLVTPIAIPLTVGLWLGAVSILVLGIFGRLPHDA